MKKMNEREYVERLIQDMRVKARDMEDFSTGNKYKKIIRKMEKGLDEEYSNQY